MSEESAARDLLLEDYRYAVDSFWKNEQTGETRVNWFIGLVTAVSASLGALGSAEHGPNRQLFCVVLLVALCALAVFGLITLLRLMKRNRVTDGFKQDCDDIRQIFKDHFEPAQVLLYYRPFARKLGPSVGVSKRASGETEENTPAQEGAAQLGRELGGLAHTVSAINCLLAAGMAIVLRYCATRSVLHGSADRVWWMGTALLACVILILAFVGQYVWLQRDERAGKRKRREGRPTHAGGILFRFRPDGIAEFLFVRPKDNVEGWVLPKGHIEDHEGHGEAALREVREETGRMARLICLVDRVAFRVKKKKVDAKFYLMEPIHQGASGEKRSREWFSTAEAFSRKDVHDESKYLLRIAERCLSQRFSHHVSTLEGSIKTSTAKPDG